MQEAAKEKVVTVNLHGQALKIVKVPKQNLSLPDFAKKEDKIYFQFLIDFLNMPYIFDNFSDHEKRRVWRRKLDEEERIFYEFNLLRLNHAGQVLQIAQILRYKYPGKFEIDLNQIDGMLLEMQSEWDNLTQSEKQKYIEEKIVPVAKSLLCV